MPNTCSFFLNEMATTKTKKTVMHWAYYKFAKYFNCGADASQSESRVTNSAVSCDKRD